MQNCKKNKIEFYSTKGDYGYFSSFWFNAPFRLKNQNWRTREHYFQAQKFVGTKYESEIRNIKSPMECAKAGRDRSKPLRKDWESVKYSIMLEAIVAQCEQNPSFKKLLLETGDAKLVEHTSNDDIWGDGGNGKGKNLLGKALMEARSIMVARGIPKTLSPGGNDGPAENCEDLFK